MALDLSDNYDINSDVPGHSSNKKVTQPAPTPSSISGNIANQYGVDIGDTYRGFGDSFNEKEIQKEDWYRDQIAKDLQLERDSKYAKEQNEFNASEAQKQRDFEERMSSTALIRQFEQMKKVGLNPLLAYSNDASTPSGSAASSGGSRSSGGYSSSRRADPFPSLLSKIAGGLVAALTGSSKAGAATAMLVDEVTSKDYFDNNNKFTGSSITHRSRWSGPTNSKNKK
ncbi:DNA pilot protein [Dipodfec virus UOA04_Rod_682]|nr:DNA pilot protein [Dipodfec virus UOA04_Rod_682]